MKNIAFAGRPATTQDLSIDQWTLVGFTVAVWVPIGIAGLLPSVGHLEGSPVIREMSLASSAAVSAVLGLVVLCARNAGRTALPAAMTPALLAMAVTSAAAIEQMPQSDERLIAAAGAHGLILLALFASPRLATWLCWPLGVALSALSVLTGHAQVTNFQDVPQPSAMGVALLVVMTAVGVGGAVAWWKRTGRYAGAHDAMITLHLTLAALAAVFGALAGLGFDAPFWLATAMREAALLVPAAMIGFMLAMPPAEVAELRAAARRLDAQLTLLRRFLAQPELAVRFEERRIAAAGSVVAYVGLVRFPVSPYMSAAEEWFDAAEHHGLDVELEQLVLAEVLCASPTLPAGTPLACPISPATLISPRTQQIIRSTARRDQRPLVMHLIELPPARQLASLVAARAALLEDGVTLSLSASDLPEDDLAALELLGALQPQYVSLDADLLAEIGDPCRSDQLHGAINRACAVGAKPVAARPLSSDELVELTALIEQIRRGDHAAACAS